MLKFFVQDFPDLTQINENPQDLGVQSLVAALRRVHSLRFYHFSPHFCVIGTPIYREGGFVE